MASDLLAKLWESMTPDEKLPYAEVYYEFRLREEDGEPADYINGKSLVQLKTEKVQAIARCQTLREADKVVATLKPRKKAIMEQGNVPATHDTAATPTPTPTPLGDTPPPAAAASEDVSLPVQSEDHQLPPQHQTPASPATQDPPTPADEEIIVHHHQASPSTIRSDSSPLSSVLDDTTDVDTEMGDEDAVMAKQARVKHVHVGMDLMEIDSLMERGFA